MPNLPLDIQFPESDFVYKNNYCDLYILSRLRVDALIHYTMSEDFINDISLAFGVPVDNFISLRMYPFDIVKLNPSIPFADGHILVGNLDSNITALLFPNISSLYFYKLGQLYFEQKTFDYRDFNPYSKYELYLPFYGYVEIDYNKYWKKNISIWYGMNYQNGTATIFLIEDSSGRVIENYECQIGVDIPIGSTNYNQIMTNLASSALKNIFSVAIGGGISASATEDMLGYYSRRKKKGDAERVRNLKADSKSSFGSEISNVIEGLNIPTLSGSVMNGVSGYSGFYSPLKCHLKVTRVNFLNPDNYAHNYGIPCMQTYTLKELKGYTKVSEVHIEGIPATDDEIGMIDAALKQGVLLPETVYELYPIRITGNNITYNAPQYISSNETKTVTITVDENYSSQLEITGATYSVSTQGNVYTIILSNPTSTVNINVITAIKQYTVTKNTIGCSINGVSTVEPNHMYLFTVVASEYYSLPSTVTVTGVESYSYNAANGYLSINNPVGNITISAYAVPAQFSISYTLNNVSAVGSAPSQINYGEVATITFEADSGYRFPNNITVTGASYTWQQSSGQYWELILSEASEDVTVTITATLIPTYSLSTAFTHMVITSGEIPSVVDDEEVVNITFVGAAGYTLPSTINVNGYNVPVNQATATYGNCAADYSISNDIGTLSLSQFTGNTTASGTATANTFSITVDAQDGSYSGDSTISTGGTATVTITPNTHYSLPSSITVINASYSYNSTTGVVSLSNPTGNVGVVVYCVADSHTLSNTITNLTVTSGTIPSSVVYSDVINITFTANSGYTLPTSVTVNGYTVNDGDGTATYGNCAADYSVYNGVGTLSLSQFTGNTTVSASGTASVYSITKSITNGSASGASTITYGSTATVTIAADSGYDLPSTVSVSGASYTYSDSTGVITLSNPTGNVTISATCPQSQPVGYVIHAGTYYGKSFPTISSLQSELSMPLSLIYSSNNVSYNNMVFSKDFRGRLYIEYSQNNPAYSVSGGWTTNYRTIQVISDTTVSQTEYEAFFGCYGENAVTLTASGSWSSQSSGQIELTDVEDNLVWRQLPANKSAYPIALYLPTDTYTITVEGGSIMGLYVSSNDFSGDYLGGWDIDKSGSINIYVDDFDD